MIYCTSVYEDEITHQVMLKIYESFQGDFTEFKAIHCHGKGKIKKQINAYNNAAQHGYYFVIVDLDKTIRSLEKMITVPSKVHYK